MLSWRNLAHTPFYPAEAVALAYAAVWLLFGDHTVTICDSDGREQLVAAPRNAVILPSAAGRG